jgi:hypothetical protein
MARFSEVVPTAGRYVNATDKAMLAADPEAEKADERADELAAGTGPVALRLTRCVYQPRAMFGPRWLVECRALANGDDIAIDFAAALKDGTVIETRQAMFAELRDRLDAGEAFDPVVLARIAPERGGNPFWTFVDAAPELVAHPSEPIWYEDADDDETPAEPVKPAPSPAKPRLRKATATR